MAKFWMFVFLWLSLSTAAWAHGSGQHVLGTVTAIDAQHIEVKTPKGATVSVAITKETRYKEKGNPKSTQPPSVGDRVVIDAAKDDATKALTATEVHYSSAKNKQAQAPPAGR